MSNERKSQTNVLIRHKEKMAREEAAILLETIATKLREEGAFTLHQGEQEQRVAPGELVTVEIELEERDGKYEFEFELQWREGERKSSLRID